MSIINQAEASHSNSNLNILPGQSCRICYEQDYTQDIISPCCCQGSMRYAHKNCVRQWILKQSVNERGVVDYVKPVSCEVCGTFYHFDTQIKHRCTTNLYQSLTEKSWMLTGFAITALTVVIVVGIYVGFFSRSLPVHFYIVVILMGLIFATMIILFFVCLCSERYEDITDVYEFPNF